MAIDEALLNTYREGVSLPVLRIYGWKKASFSFGHSQNPGTLFHLDLCEKEKVPLVRRPTGGGIIFHDDEITYSIIFSMSDLKEDLNVKETLRYITSFLIKAYEKVDKKAFFSMETKDAADKTANTTGIADFCFARNEDYDIVIDGKKIGGSAQKRKKRLILQHGSIPFSFKKEKVAPFLKNKTLLENLNTTSLNEIISSGISFAEFSNILKDAFNAHFSTTLEKSKLSEKEKTIAEQLEQEKYSQAQWNLYRQDIHR